ncbi:MAG: sugar transporter [Pseudomonadota bacterium]
MSDVAVLPSPASHAGHSPRQRWLWLSFVVCVFLPTVGGALYLFHRAADQFASTVAFSVRTEELSSPIELFGGIADIASGGSADADILYEFIGSQEIVRALDARLDLAGRYALPANDPFFAFESNGSIEDLHSYWKRMVRLVYDPATGLIEVRALAFTPQDAQDIAKGVLEESSLLIDDLSAVAQADTTAFARAELDRAVERLKDARERVTAFRSRTQIVDPTADLQGQMGLLSVLEQQLAEALINADLLKETTRAGDPRLEQAQRRITVIEARIAGERRKLGVGGGGGAGGDYATLLAEFERLAVDREFAEQAYGAALAAFDQAQAEARRKSRYLAAHINPTLAETSQHPSRFLLTALIAFFALCLWSIAVLVFYSLRDRR